MNIAFRTDSSYLIGTGHIHRCLSLAREFKKKKIKCYFFCKENSGDINHLVKKEFNIRKLPLKYTNNFYTKKNDIFDANLTIELIKKLKIDFIFLDNYAIKENWEKKVSKFCKIILISDFVDRKSFCDYYLNYNLFCENKNLEKNLKKNCIKLIGPEYSIIKELPKFKFKKKLVNKMTIFMGGVDRNNFTSKFQKIIVVGQRNKKITLLKRQIKNLKNFKILNGNKKSLYPFFMNSKLVITSVGTSMYEHFALGLNSIVIIQNRMQKKLVKNISYINLSNFLGFKKQLNKDFILKVLNKKKENLSFLFDRQGSKRIVDYFSSSKITKNAKLVKVSNKDKFFLFKLVNDSQVIKNSLANKFIDFHEHEKWFKEKLVNKNSKIFIFKNLNHKIGQIRFDKVSKNKTFITYSVANEFRGEDLGYQMLKLALEKKIFQNSLYAYVKKKNHSSIKIFKKLGFEFLKNSQKNQSIYHLKNQ